VLYDWQFKASRRVLNRKPRGPEWLAKRIGVDFFDTVKYVSLPPSGSHAELVHVGHLDGLEALHLRRRNVTDAGLIHLRSLKRLEVLDLTMTRITDAGLVHLHGLVNLKQLSLRNTMIKKNASIGKLLEALPVLNIDF